MATTATPQVPNDKGTLPAASNNKINNNNNNIDKSNDREDKKENTLPPPPPPPPLPPSTTFKSCCCCQALPPPSAAAATNLPQEKSPLLPSPMSIANNISHCRQRRCPQSLPSPSSAQVQRSTPTNIANAP